MLSSSSRTRELVVDQLVDVAAIGVGVSHEVEPAFDVRQRHGQRAAVAGPPSRYNAQHRPPCRPFEPVLQFAFGPPNQSFFCSLAASPANHEQIQRYRPEVCRLFLHIHSAIVKYMPLFSML